MSAGRLRRLGLAVLALAVLAYGGGTLARVWRLQREVADVERDLSQLRGEADRLARDVERLRTDPDYIERIAREALGLVKPGERVFKLPPAGPGG